LEKEWLNGHREPSVIERVKRLRSALLPDMVSGEISEEERVRRWRYLRDVYLAQQVSCYPPEYLLSEPTTERLLETVERFDEDLRDVARVLGPLRVLIKVGEPLEVSPGRDKSAAEDPLMTSMRTQLEAMLESTKESKTWAPTNPPAS